MKNFVKEIIAAGRMPYVSKKSMRGFNGAISSAAETVWSPGATYTQLLTGVAFEVVSTSASDNGVTPGVGARTVRLTLVNFEYVEETIDVTLNGTTAVAVTSTQSRNPSSLFIACNKMEVLTAGSSLTNVGAINVRTVSGSVVKAQIPTQVGYIGQDAGFVYTIPKDCIGLLMPVIVFASGVTDAFSIYLLRKNSDGVILGEGEADIGICNTSINTGKGALNFGSGLFIPQKSLIELRAITTSGAGSLTASAELFVFEKNNTLI